MKLREIPDELVINLASAKEENELCEILHDNGYEWCSGDLLFELKQWPTPPHGELCYHVHSKEKRVSYSSHHSSDGLTLSEFKQKYLEEEFDLLNILKGCEGEKFFSISVGEVIFKAIYDHDGALKIRAVQKDAVGNERNVNFSSDGRRNKSGLPDLYPSEALLMKYPLDPYSAWKEWKESRKPKRWRARKYQGYYYIDFRGGRLVTFYDTDEYDKDENNRYDSYNYFRTKEEAEQAAEVIKEALQKFHEKNSEK